MIMRKYLGFFCSQVKGMAARVKRLEMLLKFAGFGAVIVKILMVGVEVRSQIGAGNFDLGK